MLRTLIAATEKPRVVAFVGSKEEQTILDLVLEEGDYEIMFVKSIESAYSEIADALPDRVVVCMRADDLRSLQLLSMLNLASSTCRIPVTCVATGFESQDEWAADESIDWRAPARAGLVMH